jgi:hypothetical protein
MVVFVELDDGDEDELRIVHHMLVLNSNQFQQLRLDGRQPTPAATSQGDRGASNPNRNGFSAALSCYP